MQYFATAMLAGSMLLLAGSFAGHVRAKRTGS
jgi:hypothetical protein